MDYKEKEKIKIIVTEDIKKRYIYYIGPFSWLLLPLLGFICLEYFPLEENLFYLTLFALMIIICLIIIFITTIIKPNSYIEVTEEKLSLFLNGKYYSKFNEIDIDNIISSRVHKSKFSAHFFKIVFKDKNELIFEIYPLKFRRTDIIRDKIISIFIIKGFYINYDNYFETNHLG